MLEIYDAFSRVIEQTKNPDIEPFFEEYVDILEELNRLAMSTGEEIEGSLFNAHLVRELSLTPIAVFRYKRRNYAKYVASGRRLLEVGFNAGHSALLALVANPHLTYTGIDIGKYKYTKICYEFLKKKFGDRINMFIGDSREMLPRVASGAYDLIHIDGGHSAVVSHSDLANLIKIAGINSHILFDDASADYIIPVVSFYILTGHLSSEQLPGFWENVRAGVMPDQVLLRVCKNL
jgi:hypothetical protein